MERRAREGDRPVGERQTAPSGYPSTTGHEKPCGNLGGPSSKAKYSSVTDSEIVPETVNLQAVEALCRFPRESECATACLLHNEPASYSQGQGEAICRAVAKASLNRANISRWEYTRSGMI